MSYKYCCRIIGQISILIWLTTVPLAQPSWAESSVTGQTGLIHMPDARVAPEGSLSIGYSYYNPYPTFWSSIGLFSRLEFSARYTRTLYVSAFEPGSGFGDTKDKSFDAKLLLWPESKFVPAISIGTQDFVGTRIYQASYAALNKQVGDVDISVGYGIDRIDGWYGGLRYKPSWHKPLGFVLEYDAYDYKNDPYARQSGAIDKPGGITVALEYTYGWLGSQIFYQDGAYGASLYLSIPLMQKEFIPKLDEPKPFTQASLHIEGEGEGEGDAAPTSYRPTIAQWRTDLSHVKALVTALELQDFKNVRVRLQGSRLDLSFSQTRISLMGRAVGRAVRTALLMGPSDMSSIKITYYNVKDMPVYSYHFTNLDELQRFFRGNVTYGELIKYLTVETPAPSDTVDLEKEPYVGDIETDSAVDEVTLDTNRDGHVLSLNKQDTDLSRLSFTPLNLSVFFNDPSGALKYELYAKGAWDKQLTRGLFFNTAATIRIIENVSDVTQPSNSELPHVRTDIAKYKAEGGLKLQSFMLNKYLHPGNRWYARATAGFYEEMYAGVGGQVLYMPSASSWAFDLTVDWLKQRDYQGGLKFLKYDTVTSLAAVHYTLKSQGLTLTARAGKFLAKDVGVRMELSRRFRSGAKVGAWFTITDGKDETSPGSPSSPYYDKGIMFYIPFSAMLTKDTRAGAGFALAPWTRDVGQMVQSPGDLYDIMANPLLLDWPEKHLLSDFHK